jgi:hypothetical protein
MDTQTKREIWLIAVSTVILEAGLPRYGWDYLLSHSPSRPQPKEAPALANSGAS